MKKKTLIILAVVMVVVIAAVAAVAVGAVNDSPFTRLGEIFGRQSRMSLSGGDVVARVGGHEVTAQQVEDERAYREMGMSRPGLRRRGRQRDRPGPAAGDSGGRPGPGAGPVSQSGGDR